MAYALIWDGKKRVLAREKTNPWLRFLKFFLIYTVITVIIGFLLMLFSFSEILSIIFALLMLPLIAVAMCSPVILVFYFQDRKNRFLEAIIYAYYYSMQEALLTRYPHGVVYILENTLRHLDKFKINYLPWRSTDNRFGWPNKTILEETIDIAKHAVLNWDSYTLPEKSDVMGNLRQRIQPEVFILESSLLKKLDKTHYNIDIYKYYYDEEDYRRETGNQPPKPDFPTTYQSSPQPEYEPTPQTQPQPTQEVLTFREFLAQNTDLLYLSEDGQLEEYHKYLADMGVKPPSS